MTFGKDFEMYQPGYRRNRQAVVFPTSLRLVLFAVMVLAILLGVMAGYFFL